MPVTHNVIQMDESADAAARHLMKDLQPLMDSTKLRAVGYDIIVAVYDREGKKTAGGILIASNYDEDKFQGKVGLVISVGPMCEQHPDWQDWFGGHPPRNGDWVGINIRDGFSFLLGKHTCRQVEWKYIRFATAAPDLVM